MFNFNGGICTIILVNISFLSLVRLLLTRPHKPGKPYPSLKQHLCVRQNNCTNSTGLKFAFTPQEPRPQPPTQYPPQAYPPPPPIVVHHPQRNPKNHQTHPNTCQDQRPAHRT